MVSKTAPINVSIFGTGYVGLVTGVCLSELGHKVCCVDIDADKIAKLKDGQIPIYEPGLSELIKKSSQKLSFTTDAESAINSAQIIFIGVGTPQRSNGSCDLKFVKSVTKTIAQYLKNGQVIVVKSTVPVGTNDWIEGYLKTHSKAKNFAVVSNPEFLKEGTAVYDFFHPDRIVVGSKEKFATKLVKKLYKNLKCPVLVTDRKSAELIKYSSNAFLATKISFINSIAHFAKDVGADITAVAEGMGLDQRIGKSFLKAGIGYGGSCFPKDVQALMYESKKRGIKLPILEEVDKVNVRQKIHLIEHLAKKTDLKGKKVAVLGLAFKPNSDDIREAPSLEIISRLLELGAKVWAWDPLSEPIVQKIYPAVHYCPSPYEALQDAHAMIISTDWDELKNLDLEKVLEVMDGVHILDGRNILNMEEAKNLGFEYVGVGR
jgi:UDPglucose 6-dehydrogenase